MFIVYSGSWTIATVEIYIKFLAIFSYAKTLPFYGNIYFNLSFIQGGTRSKHQCIINVCMDSITLLCRV